MLCSFDFSHIKPSIIYLSYLVYNYVFLFLDKPWSLSFRNYDELPAPNTDSFPYENEIAQWMAEYVKGFIDQEKKKKYILIYLYTL